MRPRNYIYVAVTCLLLTIIIYVICFYDMPLSKNTTDWGAFGSYVGMGVSILSITLIYITYNEQRHSNRIERFEQHLKSMTDILLDLVKRNGKTFEADYQSFLSHFSLPFSDITNYEAKKVGSVCEYYLSCIICDRENDYQRLFNYITLMTKYIKEDSFLDKEEKAGRIAELSCIMPESFRTFYFCWLIQQNECQLLKYCYVNGMFVSYEPNDNLLSDIIRFVCTGTKPKMDSIAPIDPNDVDLDYDKEEYFDETYNRLFNNKN